MSRRTNTQQSGRTANSPFGPAQQKLLGFIMSNPGCTKAEIHERLFNDKQLRYVDNLIYENQNLIHVEKFDNPDMPHKYKAKIASIGNLVDLQNWVKTGKFVGLHATVNS